MENIESSPDPGSSENDTRYYKKTPGFANMVGELYEIKTAALLFFRKLNQANSFCLATNMRAAGAFDDLVLSLEHHTIFLQLKHRENGKKIQMSQLSHEKGDFSLLRYYKSFCDLKKQWIKDRDLQFCGKFEDALFVVYTNVALADNIKNEADNNDWHHLISTGGKCLYLTEDSCPLDSVDPTLYKEFLSQFWFCSEQATERELDILIRQELRILCGTETMYQHFLSSIENWWRNSNDYLTDKTQFWQDIAHTTKKLNLNFNENECSKIIKMMPQTVRILHVIPETYNSTNLSYLKMHQSLKNKLMVTSSTLQAHVSEVLALWSRGSWYNVLVVEGGIDNQDVIKGIADVLHSKPDKQLIVIACDPESMVMALFQEFQCKVYNDRFLLSQLNNNSYQMAMDCKFNFQGSYINLKSIGGSDVLENVVTGDIVVKLLTGDLKVGDELPEQDECYITHPLLRSERVDKGIFTAKGHDILAISGISVQEMQKLVPSSETVITGDVSNQTEANKCRYFVIDNATHFIRLCVVYDNVHWLHKQGSNFLWKTSKGDKKFIRNHVTNVTYNNLKDIVNLADQVVLFVAEPGMGKSTELSHMGSTVKQLNPTTWVVRVDLNNHVDCLKTSEVNAVDLLARAGHFNDEFQKSLLKHELLHGGNVVVMFDGFDEISPSYTDTVIGMLKELTDTKIKKVCVTSRPVMRKRLEQELLSMHFAFTHFTKENQKTFLLKFWNVSTNDYDMNNFTDELLKRTESSLNDRMSTFTGIPLQTRMLAEAFYTEAKHYSETGEIRLPHSLDLLQLYTSFVDRKWEIYYNEKNKVDMRTVGLSEDYEDLKEIFLQQHINCAVVTLLDSDEIKQLHNSRNIIKKCNSFLERFKKGREKTGIVVDIIDGRAKFIHRTFEEYFVALWFCQNFESHRNYLQEKLFDSNFQITRNFLNRMLAQKYELHIAVLNHDKDKVQALLQDGQLDVNMRDKGGRTPLHLAVMTHNNEFSQERSSLMQEIIHILFKHSADPNIEDQVFCWRPFFLAIRIGAWAAVDVLLENHANSRDLIQIKQNINDKEFVQDVLKVASRQGLVKLVEFMLGCGVPVGYQIDITNATMLHVAAEYKQLKLVQFLAEQNADIEAQNSQYKTSPLMWAADRGHLEVVQCLIELGVKLSAKDWLGNTALLRTAQRGRLEVFKLLAQHDAGVTISDRNGDTVLHHAAVSGNTELTKYILDTQKLNINCCNLKNQTPLWRAAWYGHSQIVQLLCEYNADLRVNDIEWKWTPLHVAAIKGHKKIVECLVQHGSNVTAKDKEGRTPADVAKQKDREDLVEIIVGMEQVAT